MAIQQVGGRGVYVITGSGRDPRKASNGQSWADLVTQQKYMLIQEAQKEALRQIEQEQLSFQDRQRRQEQLRQNLSKQIDSERQSINDLRLKELTLNEARERQQQRLEAASPLVKGQRKTIRSGSSGGGGGGDRTSTTLSIPTRQEVISDYTNVISRGRANVSDLRRERAALKQARDKGETLQKYAPSVLTESELADLQTYAEAMALVDKKISDENQLIANQRAELTKFENTLSSDLDAELRKRAKKTERTSAGGGGAGGGGGTSVSRTVYEGTQPVPELEPVSLQPEIERRQQRMRELQAEMDALEFEERPQFDTTERMRDIAREDYGLGVERQPREPRQPRERIPLRERFAPSRRAEMDFLGVQEPTVEQPMPEQPVQNVAPTSTTVEQPTQQIKVADNVDVAPYLEDRATPEEIENINTFLREPLPEEQPTAAPTSTGDALRESYPVDQTQSLIDGLNKYFDSQEKPTPSPAPPLTPPQGQMIVEDMLGAFGETTPQRVDYQQSFSDVQFGTPQQKQQRALQMIMEASQRLGPSNPEYQREKAKILQQLQKVMDPSQFRKQRKVERIMDKDPKNYMALAGAVRGLSEQNARLVTSLFPVSSDMKMEEIDKLYKSAQKEIATKLANPQRKKALELLELQYIAVLDDYNA